MPSIAPGTGFNLEVGVGCKVPGKWEIKLQVNTPKQFNESNYDNNTYARSFQWSDGPIPDTGLVLQSFYLQDNQPVFQHNVKKTFLMDVANTSSRNFSNIPIQIDLLTVGGTLVSSNTIQLPKLSAQEVRHEAGFQMSIARRGGYILRATVLAPSGYTDPDTSDNSAEIGLTVTYNDSGNYCTHFRNGKFPNGSAIDISMDSSVTVVSPQQVATAASYWNGITEKVSFKSLSTTAEREVNIVQVPGRIPIEGYYEAIAITDSYPRNNSTSFTGAKIMVSKYWHDQFTEKGNWTVSERKIANIAHEFGHVLGLHEADIAGKETSICTAPRTIMASSVVDANYSADMEDHDMFNLYRRYK